MWVFEALRLVEAGLGAVSYVLADLTSMKAVLAKLSGGLGSVESSFVPPSS